MRGWTFECYMNNWNHTDIKYYFLIAITFILFEAALMDRATLSQCEIVGNIYICICIQHTCTTDRQHRVMKETSCNYDIANSL